MMINFYEFDWQNDSHRKLANTGIDVLFLDEDNSSILKGILFNKEIVEQYSWGVDERTEPVILYKLLGADCEIDAQSKLFSPIAVNDKYTEIKFIGG